MSKRFFRACKKVLGDRVMNEMFQSQIEVATSPCRTMQDARNQLRQFRETLANRAAGHGLGIVAAGTHPLALWHEQEQTAKDRYRPVMAELQLVGRRDMLCGMHVHVEVPDPGRRIEIMYRTVPFLPIFLAPRRHFGKHIEADCGATARRPTTSCHALVCRTSSRHWRSTKAMSILSLPPESSRTQASSGGSFVRLCTTQPSSCELQTFARKSRTHSALRRCFAASSSIFLSRRTSMPR